MKKKTALTAMITAAVLLFSCGKTVPAEQDSAAKNDATEIVTAKENAAEAPADSSEPSQDGENAEESDKTDQTDQTDQVENTEPSMTAESKAQAKKDILGTWRGEISLTEFLDDFVGSGTNTFHFSGISCTMEATYRADGTFTRTSRMNDGYEEKFLSELKRGMHDYLVSSVGSSDNKEIQAYLDSIDVESEDAFAERFYNNLDLSRWVGATNVENGAYSYDGKRLYMEKTKDDIGPNGYIRAIMDTQQQPFTLTWERVVTSTTDKGTYNNIQQFVDYLAPFTLEKVE